MDDLEKKISDLKGIADYFFRLYRQAEDICMIQKQYDRFLVVNDAINMFKNMIPLAPHVAMGKVYCRKCEANLGEGHPLYCWHCGRAVKWDDV